LDWFTEQCYCSGLDEALSGLREDYGSARRNINGSSPFTQVPLKIVEIRLHVHEEQRRVAGRVYDGRINRIEGKLNVVRE